MIADQLKGSCDLLLQLSLCLLADGLVFDSLSDVVQQYASCSIKELIVEVFEQKSHSFAIDSTFFQLMHTKK